MIIFQQRNKFCVRNHTYMTSAKKVKGGQQRDGEIAEQVKLHDETQLIKIIEILQNGAFEEIRDYQVLIIKIYSTIFIC